MRSLPMYSVLLQASFGPRFLAKRKRQRDASASSASSPVDHSSPLADIQLMPPRAYNNLSDHANYISPIHLTKYSNTKLPDPTDFRSTSALLSNSQRLTRSRIKLGLSNSPNPSAGSGRGSKIYHTPAAHQARFPTRQLRIHDLRLLPLPVATNGESPRHRCRIRAI